MEKTTILLIDDEQDILELLEYNLTKENYKVICTNSGEQAVELVEQNPSLDLVLLDLMLPGMDGLEVCRQLKQGAASAHIPIIMFTAKGEEVDMVVGLGLGADDYIGKPCSMRILTARIKAVLRRRKLPADSGLIEVGELSLDISRYIVKLKGCPLHLTLVEFGILTCLARHRGQVFRREQLLDAVRGNKAVADDRTIDVHIVSLRKKLKDYGYYIETLRGVGYRFTD